MFKQHVIAMLLCAATVKVSADCLVTSGLDYMDDNKTVGVVECSGSDSESRRNVALAIARAKLSELTAANFEHTFVVNGSVAKSDQFVTGFAGSAQINEYETFDLGVRYQVEAHLDQELRERMMQGMANFPGIVHRLSLLEQRLKQMSDIGMAMGTTTGIRTSPEAYSITDELESIRGTVLSADEIQKRVMEYELIETGTIEYLQALADGIDVRIENTELIFNSRLNRWELKQDIRWELAAEVERPPWLEVAFVGNSAGSAYLAATTSAQIEAIFSEVVENYAIELLWGNGKRAWSVTYPCAPFYKHQKSLGVTSCNRATRGHYMAVRLQALNTQGMDESEQAARVTAALNSPHSAQEFGIIHASLVKKGT